MRNIPGNKRKDNNKDIMENNNSIWFSVKAHFYKHRYFYFVLAAVVSVCIIPFLFVQLPLGHDIYFHMTRIKGIAGELSHGNFPARVYSTIFHDYGYAAPLFYGDWLLYFPALLVLQGVDIAVAYKTFIMVCAVLAALSMYFSAQVIFKDKKAACMTSIMYFLSTYFATDAFVRHANGEFQSFIFIPIAFAGLYDIIFGDCKHWLLLPLGLCGVLVTHTLTAVMTVIFLAIFALIFIVKFIKKPKKILYVFASAGVFFLLSASFIFPMIEQLASNDFWATDGTSANRYGSLEQRSMQTILSLFSVSNTTAKVGKAEFFIPQGVGFVFPILIGWRIAYNKIKVSIEEIAFFVLALFSLFATSRFFPWEQLQEVCGILQFPWRILLFAAFFIALFGGAVIKKLRDTDYIAVLMIVVVLMSIVSVSSTLYSRYERVYKAKKENNPIEYSDYNIGNNIGLGEYLPTKTDKSALRKRGQNIESNEYLADYAMSKKDGVLILEVNDNKGEDTYIDLPLVMYKGYKATFENRKLVKEIPVSYGNNNVVRVYLGSKNAGTIKVWYEGTAIQKISFIVTLLSFSVIIAYYLILYIKKKEIKENIEEPSVPELPEV